MHGLINRSIERFVVDRYGAEAWKNVAGRAELGFAEFEAMLIYEAAVTKDVLAACAVVLDRPQGDILEDIGTYLVSHPNNEVLRRLLRFGGVTFIEFLTSVDELPQRASLALPQFDLPPLDLHEHSGHEFRLYCYGPFDGYARLVAGVLRAMADDYGVLALVEPAVLPEGECVEITLLEAEFAQGRHFELGLGA